MRALAEREELAEAMSRLADGYGRPPPADDSLAPLARDVSQALTEAGFTLRHCAQEHPLYRLGGVCLLPVARGHDPNDRAARGPYGRIPRPTPVGNSLRHTARLLSAAAFGNDPVSAQITLITRLAALVEAIAELRVAQRHAAQAAAARRAAEHLHAASAGYAPPVSNTRTKARTAAERVRLDFPMPPGPLSPGAAPPASARRPAQPSPRPSHGPGPPSRRGRIR